MAKPTPILFISDSPELATGLARITKDLATLTAQLPQFRVGVMGRGGHGSVRLPFAQYCFPESDQWGEQHIESVWDDFAGNDHGIIFTIWDPSRLGWFARPRMGGRLQRFLTSGRFEKWGYFPVDSYGVGGKLTGQVADTLKGYRRVLAYTLFGKQVLESTMGGEVDWIPHGYNEKVFQPRERTAGRMALGVKDSDTLIGCVMTNQGRKDWGSAIGAIAHLKNTIPGVKLWVHIDTITRHWNLYALMQDFGLTTDTVKITFAGEHSSEQLSYLYSACNVTMLPSLGEGFGFPLIESLACGVPVIHTNYGGGAELVPDRGWLVHSEAQRLEGPWNCVRPVLNPQQWGDKLAEVLKRCEEEGGFRDVCESAVTHLQWKNLWDGCWKKFFLSGIGQ